MKKWMAIRCCSPTVFSATRAYDQLYELAPKARLSASGKNTFALLEELINQRVDFLICERSEALLGSSLIRNIQTVHQFDETVTISAVIEPSPAGEGRRFTSWLYNFQQSDAAREL
ncbi:MAG: hypothetical protein LUD68_01525 [Rikenellaceae bacterium]|nr:hypothetical protein [Rikenellaceae bacterium]